MWQRVVGGELAGGEDGVLAAPEPLIRASAPAPAMPAAGAGMKARARTSRDGTWAGAPNDASSDDGGDGGGSGSASPASTDSFSLISHEDAEEIAAAVAPARIVEKPRWRPDLAPPTAGTESEGVGSDPARAPATAGADARAPVQDLLQSEPDAPELASAEPAATEPACPEPAAPESPLEWLTFERGVAEAARAVRRRRAEFRAEGELSAVVVAIAGPSGSGKSHMAGELAAAVGGAAVLCLDQYVDPGKAPGADRDLSFEHLDIELLLVNLSDLSAGKATDAPLTDIERRARIGFVRVEPSNVVIVEGVQALHSALRAHVHYSVALVGGAHYELARRARRARWGAGSPPSSPVMASGGLRRSDSVVGSLFPDFARNLDEMAMASLRVTNDFEPLALCVREPLYVIKAEVSADTATKARAIAAAFDSDTERVTYSEQECVVDTYLRPAAAGAATPAGATGTHALTDWVRHRTCGARRTIMFREYLTDKDLILSSRGQYEVGVSVLPALLAMGFEEVAEVTRRTETFTDGSLSVCFEHVRTPTLAVVEGGVPRPLDGRFLLVKGADKGLVRQAAERLGMKDRSRIVKSTLELALEGRNLPDGRVLSESDTESELLDEAIGVASAEAAGDAARVTAETMRKGSSTSSSMTSSFNSSVGTDGDVVHMTDVEDVASKSEASSVDEDAFSADSGDASEDDHNVYAMVDAKDAEGTDDGGDALAEPAIRMQVDASDWRTSVGPDGCLGLLPFQERNVSIDSGLFLIAQALQILRENPEGPSPVIVGIFGPRGSGVTSLASAVSVLLDDAVVVSADAAPYSSSASLGLGDQASELLRAQREHVRSELEVLSGSERRVGGSRSTPSAIVVEAPLEVFCDNEIAEAVHFRVHTSGGLSLHLRSRVQEDAVAAGLLPVEGGTSPMNALHESLLEDAPSCTSELDGSSALPPHLHILNDFDEMAKPIDPVYEAAVLVSDSVGGDRGALLRLLGGPAPVVNTEEMAIALGALPDDSGRVERMQVRHRSWQDFYLVPPGADAASALLDACGRWMRIRREGSRMHLRMGERTCPYAMWLRGTSGQPKSFREPRARPLGTPALRRPEYDVPMRTLAALLAAGYRIVGAASVKCTEYVFAAGADKRLSCVIESVDGAHRRTYTEAFVRGSSAPDVHNATRALGRALERVRESRWLHLNSTWSAGMATAECALRAMLSPISTVEQALALGLDHSPVAVAMEGVDRLEAELLAVASAHGMDAARLQAAVLLANRRKIIATRRAVSAGAYCLAALLALGVSAYSYNLLSSPRSRRGGGGSGQLPRGAKMGSRARLAGDAWPNRLGRAQSNAIELGLWAMDAISGAVTDDSMRCTPPAWRRF